jgi:DNA-binding transcriptional LysR family regulator
MNFEEISTFLTILEYGNLSTAAEKLFITQGTILKK